MATDATGAPTSLGIPKYNVSVDAPSGQGFNAAMDAIDTIITAKQLPTASGSNKVPVWNGTNWVAQTAPPAAVTPGSAGQVLSTDSAGAVGWAGGMQKIADVTIGGTPGWFDFQNIPQNHAHLLLIAHLRSVYNNTLDWAGVQFNNDAGGNYSWSTIGTTGSTPNYDGAGPSGSMWAGVHPAATSLGGWFGSQWILIPNYSTSASARSMITQAYGAVGTAVGSLYIRNGGGQWHSGSAINRVNLWGVYGTDFTQYSRATLYGIG